jgi:hypothetical protein
MEDALEIPKRFKLYGHTIEVEWDSMLAHREDARGLAVYREGKILLQPSTGSNPMPQSHIEQAFCHELTHFLFSMAGYEEDRANEEKIERVSNLLHQAFTTAEYD